MATPRTSPAAEESLIAQPGVNCWRNEQFLVLQREAVFSGGHWRPHPWKNLKDMMGERGKDVVFPAQCCAKCKDSASSSVQPYRLVGWSSRVDSIKALSMLLVFGIVSFISFLPAVKSLLPGKSLAVFAPLLVFLVWRFIGMFCDRNFTVHLPLCARHQRHRRIFRRSSIVLGVAFFAVCGSVFFVQDDSWVVLIILLSFFCIPLVLILLGWFLNPWVSVAKIDKEHIYIKGCNEAFLTSFPDVTQK